MRLVADLHIHSRYSLATSSKLTPRHLDRWARIKGIDLLGTGDCTHPAWLAELREEMEPAGEGLFSLKESVRKEFDASEALAEGLPEAGGREPPRFVLTGEVSTIYSREGKTRKVHHLLILPDFAAAAAFQARLARFAKIESDGRPILGLDSRELFKLLLDADDRSILVPAHIWTPWFSALGSRSGFDSIEECYGDLSPRIGAIETGLSSNPPMNWAVGGLDRFTVISNSDAHSPEKLGREATLIDMENSFAGLAEALAGGGPRGGVIGTVEFFPQEGKYHYDGHRACGVVLPPEESEAVGGRCPVCGKPLTSGVLRRVLELADRPVDETAPCPDDYAGTNRRPYRSLIPLKELLSELLETGENSKKVATAYGSLLADAGSEFALLLDLDARELASMKAPGVDGEVLSDAIGRMREGRVSVTPGYDGEYGVIRVFAPLERLGSPSLGTGLFAAEEFFGPATINGEEPAEARKRRAAAPRKRRPADDAGEAASEGDAGASTGAGSPSALRLDAAQERAVNHGGGPALIIAGPGTGKTAVLALRIARLVEGGADGGSILALTFTNKAAVELRSRISVAIGAEKSERLVAATFHSFCLAVLRERASEAGLGADFSILGEERRAAFLQAAAKGAAQTSAAAGKAISIRKLASYIELRKRFLLRPGDESPRLGPAAPVGLAELAAEFGLPGIEHALDSAYAAYRDLVRMADALDFDDLVAGTVRLLAARPDTLAAYRERFRHVFVDEYQDVNFAQYALIRLLVPGDAATTELCVIGDPNQAIYGFRGADRRFIDRFLADYPEAKTYRLAKSFRCAPAIIGAAGRLVGTELAGSGSTVALSRYQAPTDAAEAEHIAREIERLIGGTRFFAFDSGMVDSRIADAAPDAAGSGAEAEKRASLRSLGECAILVRAAALAPPLEKALRDHGLPYLLVGERPWWEAEPAKTLVESLRARAEGDAVEAVRSAAADLERGGVPVDAETVDRLAAAAAFHPGLAAFLDALTLGTPEDGYDKKAERIALMTIHAAKGLEFDHVFVAGLEEGILPFTLYDGLGPEDGPAAEASARVEEERRLLYVAMTRARVGLHLSSAHSRLFRGRRLALPPSRFLAEVEDLLARAEDTPRRPRDPQLGLF